MIDDERATPQTEDQGRHTAPPAQHPAGAKRAPTAPSAGDDHEQDAPTPDTEEGLDARDRTIADSFPASDPPPGPATIG